MSPWLALLGGGQIGLGLALLTVGARLIPAAQVALITLLEVVLGPLWVWIALAERPDNATLAGGAIVIAAIVVQTLVHRHPSRRRSRAGRCHRLREPIRLERHPGVEYDSLISDYIPSMRSFT